MPYLVQGRIDDHTLAVTADTAKQAFAKAIEWHVAERFSDVSIYDGAKRYSIVEFASVMSLREIANAIEDAAPKWKENDVSDYWLTRAGRALTQGVHRSMH
jgi:hypothetical protein